MYCDRVHNMGSRICTLGLSPEIPPSCFSSWHSCSPDTVVIDALVSAVTGTVAAGAIRVGTAVSIVIVGTVIGVLPEQQLLQYCSQSVPHHRRSCHHRT